MKKILIALLVLVVGAVAAGPFFIGGQVEKMTKQLVEKTNQQFASALESNPQIKSGSVTIDDYQKGYLDSEAKGVFKIAIAGLGDSKEFAIPFTTKIKHGPYLGDAGFGLAKSVTRPDLASLDLSDAITADTVVIESVVGFSQEVDQVMTVASIQHKGENGSTVDFAGATINSKGNLKNRANFTAVMDVKQLVVGSADEPKDLVIKPFTMDVSGEGDEAAMSGTYKADSSVIEASIGGDDANVSIQKLAMSGNYKQAKGIEMMLGSGELTMTDLVISPKALPEPIKVPELKVASNVEQAENEDLTIGVKYQAKLDPSLMAIMNSPVAVDDAEIDFQLKAIPLAVINDYQKLAQELMSNPEQDGAAMQAKIFELVQALAKNAASTHLGVKANAAEGELVADVDTGFKPGVNFDEAQMMQLMVNPTPSTILPLLVGSGNVSLSKGITDKAGVTPMIEMMAAEYVSLKDDKFTAEMQITDGQLVINGKALPLP